MTSMSTEDWIVDAAARILADRRDPIDRRMFDREVARVRDPVAYERRQAQLRQLKAERDADAARPKVTCAHCDASVGLAGASDLSQLRSGDQAGRRRRPWHVRTQPDLADGPEDVEGERSEHEEADT